MLNFISSAQISKVNFLLKKNELESENQGLMVMQKQSEEKSNGDEFIFAVRLFLSKMKFSLYYKNEYCYLLKEYSTTLHGSVILLYSNYNAETPADFWYFEIASCQRIKAIQHGRDHLFSKLNYIIPFCFRILRVRVCGKETMVRKTLQSGATK